MPACSGSSPFEILSGACDVWVAPVGTAFPVITATPSGSFFSLGRTEGGVTVRHTQNLEMLTTDQTIGAIKAIRTEEGMEIELGLAEITLERYAKVMNDVTVTTAAGPPATKAFFPHKGRCVTRLALLARGDSPYGAFNMQFEVPVVVQMDEPELEFVKDDKVVLNSTWAALEDLTAATEAERYGRVIAQTA